MGPDLDSLLARCTFPEAGSAVNLAVSGGRDSLGMLLLALAADLRPTVHHVDHHARVTSSDEARQVGDCCASLGVPFVLHDVEVEPGPNFEGRARATRRRVLPRDAMTAHTMDDLAETVLLNLLRGAGPQGLSPMIDDPTKPVLTLRRRELADVVAARGVTPVDDPSNRDLRFRRNRVRAELLPLMDAVAQRDVVPLLARAARVAHDDRAWLLAMARADRDLALADADCRELRTWPVARLRLWLRRALWRTIEGPDGHPPSFDEVERAIAVVRGEASACELSGGRRLARRAQRLSLE